MFLEQTITLILNPGQYISIEYFLQIRCAIFIDKQYCMIMFPKDR